MRCSNIGPRGARNWFRVLDSPRQVLSPSSRGTRCSAECNGSKLAPAATVAPLRLGARSAPPAQLPMLSLFLHQCYFANPERIAVTCIWRTDNYPVCYITHLRPL